MHTQEAETFSTLIPQKDADSFFAEYVWEHLTFEEGVLATQNCFNYLKCVGYLRLAVPDKYFKNEWYQNIVQVGDPGSKDYSAASNKIVHDYKSLTKKLEMAGFEVTLLEYCDEVGNFKYRHWNNSDGHIGRSFRYATRNSNKSLGMVSLIIDAFKPITITY